MIGQEGNVIRSNGQSLRSDGGRLVARRGKVGRLISTTDQERSRGTVEADKILCSGASDLSRPNTVKNVADNS